VKDSWQTGVPRSVEKCSYFVTLGEDGNLIAVETQGKEFPRSGRSDETGDALLPPFVLPTVRISGLSKYRFKW
jgi:hypothetical protein